MNTDFLIYPIILAKKGYRIFKFIQKVSFVILGIYVIQHPELMIPISDNTQHMLMGVFLIYYGIMR